MSKGIKAYPDDKFELVLSSNQTHLQNLHGSVQCIKSSWNKMSNGKMAYPVYKFELVLFNNTIICSTCTVSVQWTKSAWNKNKGIASW